MGRSDVDYVVADIFDWCPDRTCDVVFSRSGRPTCHVPEPDELAALLEGEGWHTEIDATRWFI